MSVLEEIRAAQDAALRDLEGINTRQALEAFRIDYLGSKGRIKALMRRLKDVPADQRPVVGKAANDMRQSVQSAYDELVGRLESGPPGPQRPRIDVTLPGRRPRIGHLHVITQTINELCEIFGRMGFVVAYGPEVEDEWHNFTALNTPPDHPARDPWDNFYINEAIMLRSQTSTVQIRVMESQRPPVRIVAPGRAYRPDTVDATHSFMFHQVEGLCVDEGVTMADLKTALDQFCKAYFGRNVASRFRPHFFPFTEPSAELDVECIFCRGHGCRLCKHSGWLELGGCGMVDPNVLQAVGYDNERYTGYAFGMGIERMVMLRHDIPDIRLLFEGDVRFLRQF